MIHALQSQKSEVYIIISLFHVQRFSDQMSLTNHKKKVHPTEIQYGEAVQGTSEVLNDGQQKQFKCTHCNKVSFTQMFSVLTFL